MLFRLAFLPAIGVAGLLMFGVPQFAEVFEAFGAPLSRLTWLYVRGYAVIACVPFLFLLVWFAARNSPNRGAYALLTSVALSLVVFVAGVWACYQPLFQLGLGS